MNIDFTSIGISFVSALVGSAVVYGSMREKIDTLEKRVTTMETFMSTFQTFVNNLKESFPSYREFELLQESQKEMREDIKKILSLIGTGGHK